MCTANDRKVAGKINATLEKIKDFEWNQAPFKQSAALRNQNLAKYRLQKNIRKRRMYDYSTAHDQ